MPNLKGKARLILKCVVVNKPQYKKDKDLGVKAFPNPVFNEVLLMVML